MINQAASYVTPACIYAINRNMIKQEQNCKCIAKLWGKKEKKEFQGARDERNQSSKWKLVSLDKIAQGPYGPGYMSW